MKYLNENGVDQNAKDTDNMLLLMDIYLTYKLKFHRFKRILVFLAGKSQTMNKISDPFLDRNKKKFKKSFFEIDFLIA